MIDLSSGKYETKYMTFLQSPSYGKKTHDWRVLNTRGNYPLGRIYYYSGWRQYVFEPSEGTEFNKSCMVEIADVLSALNATTYQQKKLVEANGK